MTAGLPSYTQPDALDTVLTAYLEKVALRPKLIARGREYTNDKHRTGVSRRSRQYCISGASATYSIYAKQYDSPGQAQKEFKLLLAYRELVVSGSGVASVEPLFCAGDVILCAGAEGLAGEKLLSLPDRKSSLLTERFYGVGKWLAAFHSAETGSTVPAKDCRDYRRFLHALLQAHMHDFAGRYIALDLSSAVERTLANIIDSVAASSLYGPCHGDFCPQNIVVDVNKGSSTVLDFEDIHVGYQVKDMGAFCAKLRLLELIMPQHSRLISDLELSFLAGYAESGGIAIPDIALVRHIYMLRVASPLRYGRVWHVLHNIGSHLRRIRYESLLKRELHALRLQAGMGY
jgi:hypothetical protein